MNKTRDRECIDLITVDAAKLAAMLSCGLATARKIGENAEAKIIIGRRVLYSVDKVREYINSMSY